MVAVRTTLPERQKRDIRYTRAQGSNWMAKVNREVAKYYSITSIETAASDSVTNTKRLNLVETLYRNSQIFAMRRKTCDTTVCIKSEDVCPEAKGQILPIHNPRITEKKISLKSRDIKCQMKKPIK
jgi:hypothetical protein